MRTIKEITKQGQPKFGSVHLKFGGAYSPQGVFPHCEEMTAGEIIKRYLFSPYKIDSQPRTVSQIVMSYSKDLQLCEGVRAYICKHSIRTDMGNCRFNCCVALSFDFIADYDIAVKIANDVMFELGFACLKEEPKEASDLALCQHRTFPTDHTIYLAAPDDLGSFKN